MNTIERLENWKSGHKNRSVAIEIDDGYGATCWSVYLAAGSVKIEAHEVSFFECTPEQVPETTVFVRPPWVEDDDNDYDRPGLEQTINATIDRAEQLGFKGRPKEQSCE